MWHHRVTRIALIGLLATHCCQAFLSSTRSTVRGVNVRRSSGNVVEMSWWRGLGDIDQRKNAGSGVLTPKSRVKLGDLSVSPMGKPSAGASSSDSAKTGTYVSRPTCFDYSRYLHLPSHTRGVQSSTQRQCVQVGRACFALSQRLSAVCSFDWMCSYLQQQRSCNSSRV